MTPEVSVIMPVYNEEAHLEECLRSLIGQTIPREKMEWIVVDSGSTDATPAILERFRNKGPFLLLSNPGKPTPSSLNMAIRSAGGRYIIRMDAHSVYQRDYIARCIRCLEHTGAENAGGVCEIRGEGVLGKGFAALLSSPFGAGGADFRTAKGSGFVETVPFGAWRRELFDRIGLFNEELVRSEDNDLNQRIRASGGKIYLDADIRTVYYCRSSLRAILRSALNNGNALFHTLRRNPGAMRLRHYVPFLFLLSVLTLGAGAPFLPVCGKLLSAELAIYFLMDLYFSLRSVRTAPVTIWLFPTFHLTYGLGSALGMVNIRTY